MGVQQQMPVNLLQGQRKPREALAEPPLRATGFRNPPDEEKRG